jgi:hypothetical protein
MAPSKSIAYCNANLLIDSVNSAIMMILRWDSQVGVELPIDSDDADEENKTEDGRTLLNILARG